jgi:hypothetical protein
MTSKVVAGGASLTFQRTRRVPCALMGQEDVQQVVLKIYVACESLVVLAEKESRCQYTVTPRHDELDGRGRLFECHGPDGAAGPLEIPGKVGLQRSDVQARVRRRSAWSPVPRAQPGSVPPCDLESCFAVNSPSPSSASRRVAAVLERLTALRGLPLWITGQNLKARCWMLGRRREVSGGQRLRRQGRASDSMCNAYHSGSCMVRAQSASCLTKRGSGGVSGLWAAR